MRQNVFCILFIDSRLLHGAGGGEDGTEICEGPLFSRFTHTQTLSGPGTTTEHGQSFHIY